MFIDKGIQDVNSAPDDKIIHVYTWGNTAPTNAPSGATYATMFSWCSTGEYRGFQMIVSSSNVLFYRAAEGGSWRAWKTVTVS